MPFDPKLVEARIALTLIGPDEMPGLAWDAMEAGLDGPSIRKLAALEKPSGWEVDQILPGFMDDAGLKRIPLDEAATRVALQWAERILRENLDPFDYAKELELLWIRADYPRALQNLGTLRDDRFLAEYHGRSEKDVQRYARQLLMDLIATGTPER